MTRTINKIFVKPESRILSETSRCVMCGLCLPHCPTYHLTQNENESPRGRIALARALADGKLSATEKLRSHIEQCLLCRACETVCPSQVRYGQIMDSTRELLNTSQSTASDRGLLANKTVLNTARIGMWLYRKSGLNWLAGKSGITRFASVAKLHSISSGRVSIQSWKGFYPATTTEKERVALFTGCLASIADQDTLNSTITVLNHLGYGVYVPQDQNCCGALFLHNGERNKAETFAHNNIKAFAALGIKTIITTATGCSTTLGEYAQLIDSEAAGNFSVGVTDINRFLSNLEWDGQLQSLASGNKVLFHEACSMKTIPGLGKDTKSILSRIPGIQLEIMEGRTYCCGAAGDYMLKYPQTANTLREPILDFVRQLQPDYLVTSNIGCAVHIRTGLVQAGLKTEVLHPVSLIARQLKAGPQRLSNAS